MTMDKTSAQSVEKETENELVTFALADPMYLAPSEGEILSDQEFAERGAALVEVLRDTLTALGLLLDHFMRQKRIEDRMAFMQHWAREWGTSRPTLERALVIATKFPDVERPKDLPESTLYTILANSPDAEAAELGIQQALRERYTADDTRKARELQNQGFQPEGDWSIPQLYATGNEVYAKKGSEKRLIATLTDADDDLSKAGKHLLLRRGLK